jgi:hypothetical protein
MTSDSVSAKGIKARMPHPILARVFGKPTHKQIKTVIRKLLANLMAISCPCGHCMLNVRSTTKPLRRHNGLVVEPMFNKSVDPRAQVPRLARLLPILAPSDG